MAVGVRTISADFEAAGSLGCAKARGGLGTEVNDLIEAGNIVVPLAHPQIGSYVESFQIDVAV